MEDVIADRYEMQDPIGRGGMATIYRAVDLRMGRIVAVKILREVYSSDPKFVTRFQREARAASALQHPNIVQVYDYGQSGDSYFIVMEFIDGTDLRRYLKRTGILPNERAVEIAHDVALALGAAHRRGIVHRDVKPQNVLLNENGTVVKLTDFGIASMYSDAQAERLTTTGMTLGTVQYYAPEQAQGEVVDPAADVYALGIVMYEMLTGRTPFDGDTPVAVAMRHIQDMPEPPSRINPRISQPIERIIMRCLEKDPRDRFRDGDTLAAALSNYMRSSGRRTVASAASNRAAPGTPAPWTGPSGGPRSQLGGGAPNSGPRGGGPNGRGRPMMDLPGREPEFGPAPGFRPGGPPRGPGGGNGNGNFPRRPDDERRSGNMPIIIASAVAVLLVSCLVIATIAYGGKLFQGPSPTPVATVQMVKVPDFTASLIDAAQTKAQAAGLKIIEKDVPNANPKGTVIDQDKPPNSLVPVGSSITLSVSAGPGTITVPDVVGKNHSDACNLIVQAVGTSGSKPLICQIPPYQFDPTVPYDTVISQDPIAGSPVAPGTQVKIIVSKGPAPTVTATKPACPTATPIPTTTPGMPTPSPAPC
ncbi:MAG TPA: protein kinase [Ktedonobacterales bacterium]